MEPPHNQDLLRHSFWPSPVFGFQVHFQGSAQGTGILRSFQEKCVSQFLSGARASSSMAKMKQMSSWPSMNRARRPEPSVVFGSYPEDIYIYIYMAVGQNQWYHFGVGAPAILVYFSGDWDVQWQYEILTRGRV